jgi:ATP-dependent protease ClpP protease subunit
VCLVIDSIFQMPFIGKCICLAGRACRVLSFHFFYMVHFVKWILQGQYE